MGICSVQLKLAIANYQEKIENLFILKIVLNHVFPNRKQHKNWAKFVFLWASRKKRVENL